MKELLARVLCALGVPALARWRHRRRLAILMYHGVEERPLSPRCWHVLDVATFRRQVEWVRRRYRVLPLSEALSRRADGTLPPRSAVLTFDDGMRNLLTVAKPVLDGMGLPAAAFLTTGPMGTSGALWPDRLWLAFARTEEPAADLSTLGLGSRALAGNGDRAAAYEDAVRAMKALPDAERQRVYRALVAALDAGGDADPGPFRLLSWDEAKALASGGRWELCGHSLTHPILSRCDDAKVEREVGESHEAVTRATGTAPVAFAWPNGRAQDFDARARAALSRRGVRFALSTVEGLVGEGDDPLALPRIAVGSDLSFARFRLLVSGAIGGKRPRLRSGSAAAQPPKAP